MDFLEEKFDTFNTRFRLAANRTGKKIRDWLFLPGGAGIDSQYLMPLISKLSLPGKTWLIDLPNNGDNKHPTDHANYDFDSWAECFITAIERFEKPVLIGHSFSGMYPLLFPALESQLSGFISLNAAPCLWFEAAEKRALQQGIKPLTETAPDFSQISNRNEFNSAVQACLPYYFRPHAFEAGTRLLQDYAFNYKAALWWMKKVSDINFNAAWIPHTVPTLLIGSSHDFSVPFSCFQNDKRFQRENIHLVEINNAGHFPWIENCNAVVNAMGDFSKVAEEIPSENLQSHTSKPFDR